MSLVKEAFPNYDDVLPMLEGFEDCSYKNDSCPSISKELGEEIRLMLYCDYKNKYKREDREGFRYCLSFEMSMILCNSKILLLSDDIMEVKRFIEKHTLADFINMPSFDYDINTKYY
jgi:hypothetical protein